MMGGRGRIPFLLLLVLVLFGLMARIVGGLTAAESRPVPTGQAPAAPASTPTPPAGPAREVARSLAAVQRAFNAGDVTQLCRPGALLDTAVIRRQNAQSGGCEAELEGLMTDERPLRLRVRQVALRPDLASATVATASGASVPVDLVRHGRRWLVSFSDGDDPLPALAGAT
jgi:hypothetical protein